MKTEKNFENIPRNGVMQIKKKNKKDIKKTKKKVEY